MRMPGSINYSTGKRAMILRVGEMNPTLAKDLVSGVPAEAFITPVINKDVTGLTWQQAKLRVSKKAADYLTFGWEAPGRHETLWHTVQSLKEVGVSREEALKGVTLGNALSRPAPLEKHEVDAILTKIYLDSERGNV
jgi:hypothetical protein